MTGAGVLAVFAHPDDESLLAGGTLAACSAAGLEVALLSMTRGELGPAAGHGVGSPAALGAAREAELREAASELGISDVECLGHGDGELASVEEREAIADLARRIESRRPRALITFSEDGLYWHPDHLAVHGLACAAARSAPVAPLVYGATWPHGHARRLVEAMEGRGLAGDLWGLDPDAFGAEEGSIELVIDARRFLPAKLRALRRHRSQLGGGHLLAALPDDLAEELLGREYFVPYGPTDAATGWLAEVVGGAGRSRVG